MDAFIMWLLLHRFLFPSDYINIITARGNDKQYIQIENSIMKAIALSAEIDYTKLHKNEIRWRESLDLYPRINQKALPIVVDKKWKNKYIKSEWMQVLVHDIKAATSSEYGKIGRVNKPSRQEFMDAKYKRKNFAKDYLMKGKKW